MSPLKTAVSCGLLVCLALGLAPAQEAKKPVAAPMSIGMAKGFFNDISPALVAFVKPSFAGLMKECTGLDGQLVVGGDYLQLTKDLKEKKLQLAVYHGFEFAWAREVDPELQPLMIAINHFQHVHAHLMVKAEGDINSFADLKGKEVSFHYCSKEHCRLFLEKNAAGGTKSFFQKVSRPGNSFKALDEVLTGAVPAAIVDKNSLATYAENNPSRRAKLKIAVNSEKFPAAVIVYRKGCLDEPTLKKFRDGMLAANQNERCREIMHMYSVTAFEPLPADYEQNLVDIMKSYPAPTR